MLYCIALVSKDIYCNHEHFFAQERCANSKMYYHIQALKHKNRVTKTEHMVLVTSNCSLLHNSVSPSTTQRISYSVKFKVY